MANTFLDQLLEGVHQLTDPRFVAREREQGVPQAFLKSLYTVPPRALLEAWGAIAQTGAGLAYTDQLRRGAEMAQALPEGPLRGLAQATLGPTPGSVDVGSVLAGVARVGDRADRVGLEQALEAERFGFQQAPEAVPAQKFLLEATTDPTNLLAPGTGAALRQVGRAAPRAVAPAFEAAGAGADVYNKAATAVATAPFEAFKAGLARTPLGQRSKPAQAAFEGGALRNTTLGLEEELTRRLVGAGLPEEAARTQAHEQALRLLAEDFGATMGRGVDPRQVAPPPATPAAADAAAPAPEPIATPPPAGATVAPPAVAEAASDLGHPARRPLATFALYNLENQASGDWGVLRKIRQEYGLKTGGGPLDVTDTLRVAEAAAGTEAKPLLNQAEQYIADRGIPRSRRGAGGVSEPTHEAKRQSETVDDIAKALIFLRDAGAPITDDGIRAAQARFIWERYGDTMPFLGVAGGKSAAVQQRIAREQGQAPPVAPSSPPVAAGADAAMPPPPATGAPGPSLEPDAALRPPVAPAVQVPERQMSAIDPALLNQAREDMLSLVPNYDPAQAERWRGNLQQFIPGYDRDHKQAQALAQRIGAPAGGSLADALATAQRKGLSRESTQLRELAGRYGGADLLQDSADTALGMQYLQRYSREVLRINPKWTGRTWNELLTAWRQQALFAPAYHVNNVLDAGFKTYLYLGGQGLRDLGHDLAPAVRQNVARELGQDSTADIASDAFFRLTGQARPDELTRGATRAELREAKGLERVPYAREAVQFNRGVAEGIEQAARTASFIGGYKRQAAQQLPAFADQIDALVPGTRQAILDTEGLLDPARLETVLQQAGATPAATQQALAAFGQFRTTAYNAGLDLTHKIHFDYRDTTNLDEFLRQIMGFHLFATRNLPLYAEILATHPLLLRSLVGYRKHTEELQRQAGMEDAKRRENTVGLGDVGRVLSSALFGQQGDVFFNPLRYISIMGQLFQTPYEAKGQTPLGALNAAGGQIGMSLNPLITTALAPTGALGAGQPQTLGRLTPMLNQLATLIRGAPTNLEAPLDWWQRQRLDPTAPRPTDPDTYVRLRLAEMSLQQRPELGGQVAPEFERAMAEGRSNPLWQQAERELARQRLPETVLSWLGAPVVAQSDVHQRIAAARAGLPEVNAEGGRRPLEPVLARRGHEGERLVTRRDQQQALAARVASGLPEAAAYESAFRQSGGPRPAQPSRLDAMREQVLAQWLATPPERMAAFWAQADDNTKRVILDYMYSQPSASSLRQRQERNPFLAGRAR